MNHKSSLQIASLLTVLVMLDVGWTQPRQQDAETPEGYEQILPRGGIPAIDKPVYVTADQARIKDNAFVLGAVIEGTPIAFSLSLLNSHEVVNDTVGKTNFAAVW